LHTKLMLSHRLVWKAGSGHLWKGLHRPRGHVVWIWARRRWRCGSGYLECRMRFAPVSWHPSDPANCCRWRQFGGHH